MGIKKDQWTMSLNTKRGSMQWIITLLFFVALGAIANVSEAQQQPARVWRIGYLSAATASATLPRFEAFRQGLHELGYMEGKNIAIVQRHGEGSLNRVPNLAAELVGLKVDVIFVGGDGPAIAAKQATSMIPIVVAQSADPVGSGIVASLARPGGNVTGLTLFSPELTGRRLGLLKESFPTVSRVAILWNPTPPQTTLVFKDTQASAQRLGLQLESLEVRRPDDFDGAFRAAARSHAQALIVIGDALMNSHRTKIVDFAVNQRLPAMYPQEEYGQAGGLISYTPNLGNMWHRAAWYVDKILKGAKPADLPVERPTKFELVINLKTAKALGLKIPAHLLMEADKVIE